MPDREDVVLVQGGDAVHGLVGRVLGPSPWVGITQDGVDAFGRAVLDWHWAHNDPDRAARGPFATTIAHAHLTLGLIPHLRESVLGFASGECMFYGYNRVRFPATVPVGSRIRLVATVVDVDDIAGGEQLTLDLVLEIEGHERPGCVAQAVFRHYEIDAPA
ncbi:MaoC family dehydratase [Nocardioides sp. P5_C9_2]